MLPRSATIHDAEAFAQISAETFALACPPNTSSEDLQDYIQTELTPARFAQHIASPSKIFYSIDVDGKPAGYVMLSRDSAPDAVKADNPLELQRIYVLQAHHGSGIAGTLFEQALTFAEKNNHDVLWLGVSKHNQRGQAFYRKNGFKIVGEQRFPVGQDIHEDWIMARPLLPQVKAGTVAAL